MPHLLLPVRLSRFLWSCRICRIDLVLHHLFTVLRKSMLTRLVVLIIHQVCRISRP